MKITGVICEYNPFHNGHAKQLASIKNDSAVLCLMSGNYVQRGEPAVIDKFTRAKAAVTCGADLVLELPVTYALRSAEGFADGGVEILDRLGCVAGLCFGSESGSMEPLQRMAEVLLSTEFSLNLKEKLAKGLSFPAARQEAVEALGFDGTLLKKPNDILGIEYCKALLRRNSTIKPLTIRREGSYHEALEPENPSAAALRGIEHWNDFMPSKAFSVQSTATRHTLQAGQRAVLAKLRSMEEKEFEALPFGSEGLWRKVMHACYEQNTLEEIIAAAKSKRYTRTRLTRMLLCAFLEISEDQMKQEAPYVRILAMNEQGGKLLREIRQEETITLLHGGEKAPQCEYAQIERRAEALYGLFCAGATEAPVRRERVEYCTDLR